MRNATTILISEVWAVSDMTLIFSGNNYKYQLEAVMKLFIPAERFELVYTDRTAFVQGDHAFLRRASFGAVTTVYAVCSYKGRTAHCSANIRSDISDLDDECQITLCRVLYLTMSKLTGITFGWGMLTGVRPVKRVNKLISAGASRDEVFSVMSKQYFVSKEKTEIAYLTANTQEKIVRTLDDSSFSLYVSIPFCPTRCSYCSFISQTIGSGKKLIPDYISNLCKEIRYTAKLAEELGLRLDTIYFGGGTPTSVEASQLERIMQTVAESFDMSSVREYTVEAGRADTITREKLEVIKRNGATRLSVNPQTLNDSVLEAIGRKHTVKQFFDAYDLAKQVGFDLINTDIIAGLPTDTTESFCSTIDRLIDLSPENITVHTLSIKRAADLNHSDNKGTVLKNPASLMVDYATRRLLDTGYLPYYLYRQKNMLENLENIGWCRQGSESLYNIFIMEEIQTILAVGAGASSKLVDLKGGRLERIFNYKHPIEYNKHFELMLDKKKEIVDFYAEKK